MKTGFNKLDNIINLEEPQVIMISGTLFSNLLSGDIANNVSLKQGHHVLEIVSCKKEYLIKRLIINKAKVSYNKWCLKDKYTEKELQEIGQATVNLIKVTKRLPTIIEQEMNLYNLKKVAKLVSDYAKRNADETNTLVVLDIFPLNEELRTVNKKDKRYTKQNIKIIKNLKQISNKLKCNIIFTYDCKARESYNRKESICNISRINKYVDKFIVTNIEDTKTNLDSYIFNVDVYNRKEKIGSCKLKYDCQYRQFLKYDKY